MAPPLATLLLRLAPFALLLLVGRVEAVTQFAGRMYHLAVFGSQVKFPIFTKEFAEGPGFATVGGKSELWLPDQQKTFGLRFGFEDIGYNRAGLGLGLTLWYSRFADATFNYDRLDNQNLFATYRDPSHLLASFDLSGLYLPWESPQRTFGFYGMLSLVADYERYTLERFALADGQSRFSSFAAADREGLALRFGFGLGTRLYLGRRLSVWLEKRWIMGETFSTGGRVGTGGFIEDDRQRTLFAPINSLGLALSF